jgi:hypothetical protein
VKDDGTQDMPLRKWLVRGFVYAVLGSAVVAVLLYHFWTSPATVRRRVLAKLAERFPGATISLDSAHLRLFGGIAVAELRMARRDDLDKSDFLYVPSAIIYHDKEQMLDGVLAIRKVEIFRPRLRVVRERDGRLNLAGLAAPCRDDREPLATVVVQQGTIVFEDRCASPATPLLEIKDVSLTVVNDPVPMISIDGGGRADVLGPVRISARLRRDTGAGNFQVELASIPIGPALVQRFAAICPDAAAHLRGLRADGEARATISYRPEVTPSVRFDVSVKLRKGELTHARLPLPLEDLEGDLRFVNAATTTTCQTATPCPGACPMELVRVPSATLKARSGAMRLDITLEDLIVPCSVTDAVGEELNFDRLARKLEWKIEHLPVTKKLLDHFASLRDIQDDYRPSGPATVRHTFNHDSDGGWHKTWLIDAERMSAQYVHFPYQLDDITGSLRYEKHSDHSQKCSLDLTGKTAGRTVTIRGSTHGEHDRPSQVELNIHGDNIPLDDKLRTALQGPSLVAYDQFHPQGRADFDVTVRRAPGDARFTNRYLIRVKDAAFSYDLFPYPLKSVSGVLELLPDHWEARDFHGYHGTGVMRFSGRTYPTATAGQRGPQLRVEIHGQSISLDDKQFEAALAPPGLPERTALKAAWQTLAVSGKMNFDAEVLDLGGDPANLDVKVTARGLSMRPEFFKYSLDDVGGTVHYTRERVTLADVQARHGAAMLGIRSGQILAKPGGCFQTRLGNPDRPDMGIVITGMSADADLLAALPPPLRSGLEAVHLRGPFDLSANMVVDPLDEGKSYDIWWDGHAVVRNASFQAGVDVTGVQGTAWCCGLYRDQKLRSAVGNVWFTDASVLGQPFHQVHTNFVVKEDTPDLLRFYNVGAELFGGQVGGQAHIDFSGAVPRFELNLIGLQIKLEQFGRYNELGPGAELQGAAELSLFLKGKADDISSLSGDGRLDVPNGKLYRLPPLLDLLKAFGLRAPDRTAFERARLEFSVEGPQVRVNALNLIGSAVSLRGQGTVRIDGSDLNLDFNADPGMLPQVVPFISGVQQTVSDQLLKIKARGSLTDPRFEKELMPGVVEPVRRLLGAVQ